MDIRKIKKLINLVKDFNISKLEIFEKNKSIKISNKKSKKNFSTIKKFYKKNIKSLYSKNKKSYNNELSSSKYKNINKYIIKSPMVGTFYRSPSPNAKPFIEIGQKINIGDVLCIIEAMKMMNQIKSDRVGIVKSIFLKNGQSVEYDEPLIALE
ncbi:acetyl-CoA carboxylase biotin carboxyl carrier protein [Sodalis-like secondary symbiont of Drepanosiphum platanoidis]|uniref:acetyl-CoA carboxylase biotin carboxyl carrier protein n=1 Tax=Sodalis-like secondary symbiont of Drepanosiphum platanoidis TaxID=2994493 RepID=UPI003464A43D